MRLVLFAKLKHQSNTVIVGIKYSVRDLLLDANNYAWPTK